MEHIHASQFNLPDQTGTHRTSSEFIGKKILLYFYPKDMTPGCTTETLGFQEMKKDFENLNTVIIGVSKDTVASHQKFCEKHNLDIILLSDESTDMIQAYGVWKEKNMYGKTYMGISRESFLIDEAGLIIKHWEKVKPATHPQEVFNFLTEKTA